MSSRRTDTNHTPSFPRKERRKDEGGHYGGPRRAAAASEREEPQSAVRQAFDNPDNQPDSWQQRTGARTSINDIRSADSANSKDGWCK